MGGTKVAASLLVAITIIGGGLYFRFGDSNQSDIDPTYERASVGEIVLGAEHTHATMAVFINGAPISFDRLEYSDLDEAVHFHDGNGSIIHKHASGITIPYFFETLGVKITQSCLTISNQSFCSDKENILGIYVNKELINENLSTYEIDQGDKILVNYGNDSQIDLGIKFNLVPDLPEELSRPLETDFEPNEQ